MDDITQQSYNKEIESLAYDIAAELLEEHDNDREQAEDNAYDRIHETIDGHQWVIYYAYNLPVLEYSDNAYYADEQGLIGENPLENGLNSFHTMLAFWAMNADVSEAMEKAFDWALQPNEGE